MSRPRQVLTNQFYMLTRACTQRQFLLRPDATTNNIYAYCVAEAAKRYNIDILLPTAESNHHHITFFDRDGNASAFAEHVHKLLARCLNARWGRRENLWVAEEPCLTRLLDRSAVIAKLAYVAANPVKDLLVERAVQWPGMNGYRLLLSGRTLTARRPRHFFSRTGLMPESVELELVIPDVLGPREQVIAEVRARVEKIEEAMRRLRRRTGRGILGRRTIMQQRWHSSPTSVVRRGGLRPRFAGRSAARIPALQSYREFLARYDDARRTWIATGHAEFPPGTYWLARFAPIRCGPAQPFT